METTTRRLVACVYRTGGEFTFAWVDKLLVQLDRHVGDTVEYAVVGRFGDDAPPGWWAKLSLFDPETFEAGDLVLYLDLDTLVVGDLTDLVSYDGDFAMLSDFYRPSLGQSGVMLFRAGSEPVTRIWDAWSADPEHVMCSHRGDGEFIRSVVPEADRIQALYPGQVVSYKVHAHDGIPDGARLVCGHGKPRFSDPAAGWAHQLWSATGADDV